MYSDDDVAALYDRLNPWVPSDDFYLSCVLEAPSVLDVGCGTGRLLHRAREAGHGGRLCGVDPDPASLARARRRDDVEWVEGRAAEMTWEREFALAVMASVESVVGDVVTLTETTATRDGEALRADRGRLRFLDAEEVGAALGRAGFEVEAWYGDWSRGPLTEGSDNIVVVAGATSAPHGR